MIKAGQGCAISKLDRAMDPELGRLYIRISSENGEQTREIHSGRNYSIKSRGQRYNCLNREILNLQIC